MVTSFRFEFDLVQQARLVLIVKIASLYLSHNKEISFVNLDEFNERTILRMGYGAICSSYCFLTLVQQLLSVMRNLAALFQVLYGNEVLAICLRQVVRQQTRSVRNLHNSKVCCLHNN